MGSDVQASRIADVDLARRCLSGERAAQRAFFEAHRRRVHCILFRMLGSNREIDDLIQDAFVEVFRSLPTYRGDAQLGTWIDRICVRVGIRFIAARSRERARVLDVVSLVEDGARGPDRRAEARDAARRLYAALDRVAVSHRTAFALHVVDGRPLAEVAEIMGASVIATKLRVWRTRQWIERAARQDPVLRSFLDGAA